MAVGPPAPSMEVGGVGAKSVSGCKKRRVSLDLLIGNQRIGASKSLILLS
jgi:hypothetical protein